MGKIAQRVSLEEATAWITPRCELGIGGLHFHNTPMAVVRELIRKEIPIGRLVPPADASINADQLIGAGLVEEVHAPYVGLEHFGMAGRFRAAVEAGTLRVRECEEAGFMLGLMAAASGLPFVTLPEDFMAEAEDAPTVVSVNEQDYRRVEDPFTGKTHVAARAIRPDVAVIHCQVIDRRGNCGFLGGAFMDIELAKAARACVVVCEREVDELPPTCRAHLPGFVVDAYAIVPHGAHPGSSHGCYRQDDDHLAAYATASRSDQGFADYREDMIGDSEEAYRRNADLERRMPELSATAGA
jgi:glutaconate CoA-transferase subunit A